MATNFLDSVLNRVKQTAIDLGKQVISNPGGNVLTQATNLAGKSIANWAFPDQGQIIKQLSTVKGQSQFQQEPANDLRTNVRQYIGNRYIAPVAQVPYNLGQTFGQGKSLIDRGLGAIGVAGGTVAMIPDPIGDVAMPAYDYLKGVSAAQKRGEGTLQSYKTGIKSLTGQKVTGLGSAVPGATGGAESALNLAELPLMIFAAGKFAKTKEVDNLVKRAAPEIENTVKIIKQFDTLTANEQMIAFRQVEELAKRFIPKVVGSEEMKKVAKTDGKKWLDTLGTYLQDRLVLATHPELNAGFNTRAVKRLETKPEGGVKVNNRTGSYKENLDQSVAQISKPVLEKQLQNVSPTRTKAIPEVSSPTSITEKGKLNLKNLNVSGAGKEVLKANEASVKPTVIGNKEVIESAKLANGNRGAMTDSQMKKLLATQLKNRQQVVDLNVRFNQAKQNGATEAELGKIMLDMANQSKVARQGGTFAGRLLQAQNIMADESASPTQKILALLDNAGVAPEKYLQDSVKVNWDNPTEVVNFYRKYVPPTLSEVLDEVRYTNMLSSPLTHIINTFSNVLQTAAIAPIEKTISGVLDWGKSALTGSERQYYVRSGIDYAGGYVKSLPSAFKKAVNVLSGQETLVKPDYQRIPTGTKGVLKAYTLPLRGLEAADQFFKTLVEGGVTAELKARPEKLPMQEIASRATKEANYRLFRQGFDPNGELGQGVVLQTFDRWNSAIANLRRLPGGKWVLPFLQTPTNILKQGLEYSPLGVSTTIGAKAPIEQLSKSLIGTGVFIGAYQLAKQGLTTWESPTSETERTLYYEAGMQPYSVKVGNNWVSFSKLGPLSYPIAMAAALANAEKTNPDKSTTENISKGISGILGFFGDQSYVRSIGDLVDAIQGGVNIGPNALAAEGANLAGQLVPYKSFLTWLGRITDPVYRKASTFGERMAKDLPIVGSKLQPYTDLQGNPSKRDYPVLNAVSPAKVTQEKQPAAGMLEQYQGAKIDRAIQKRADEQFLAGDKTSQTTGGIYRYVNKDGDLKKIDTTKVTSMPESNSYEKLQKQKAAYALTDDILNLPIDQQVAVFASLGISPDDATYYQVAKGANDLKSAYLSDGMSKLNTKDRGSLINYLVSQRKVVNGDMVLTDTIINKMNDDKLISDSEATMLKNLKIVNGKPVTKLSGRGKKVTLKKVSALPAPLKIKAPTMSDYYPKNATLKSKRYKFRRSI